MTTSRPRSRRRIAPLFAAAFFVLLFAAAGAAAVDAPDRPSSVGWLGVELRDVDGVLADALGLDEDAGVLIERVVDDSPAATAKLERGDVILEIDGEEVDDSGDLASFVRSHPGETVKVEVFRRGKKKTLEVTLGRRARGGDRDREVEVERELDPRAYDMDERPLALLQMMRRPRLGVRLQNVDGELATYFDVEKGTVVVDVAENSPAAAAGLHPGDVILRLGDRPIESAQDVRAALAAIEKLPATVKLIVKRHGKEQTFEVSLDEPASVPMFVPSGHDAPRMCPDRMEELEGQLDELRRQVEELREKLSGDRDR